MANFNRVIMIGNLTRDPELRQLSSGQSLCRMSIASNRQFKNKQTGSLTQEVCFIDVDVWGPQADNCNQYLQKGKQVLIEGRLKFDTWEDTDGNKKSKHSIVAERVTFLGTNAQQTEDYETDRPMSPDELKAAIKSKESNKSTKKSSGEIDFDKEAPFEDDLPF